MSDADPPGARSGAGRVRLLAITGALVSVVILVPALGVLIVLAILAWIRWTWSRA